MKHQKTISCLVQKMVKDKQVKSERLWHVERVSKEVKSEFEGLWIWGSMVQSLDYGGPTTQVKMWHSRLPDFWYFFSQYHFNT